jgi:hypothetical protein
LGSCAADDEDIGGGVGRRCWRVLRLCCDGVLLVLQPVRPVIRR